MPAIVVAGRYELRELLGEGGMGVVYRALDTRTNSPVAIKTLRDASDPQILELFKKEWAELAKLSHPNIVDIRDVGEIEEDGVRKPCFVMPLLPGATLATLIKNSSSRLTVGRVLEIIYQASRGLQAAHEKGLIHRDLKPSNIFVMDDNTAKLIDFGLVHSPTTRSITGLKGTWQYMAPEQAEGKPPSRRSDIFSLGVVAYEALTGIQPFKRAKLEDTIEAVKRYVPPAISETNSKVTPLVGKAIHVAMAKQPILRYASAREFSEILQKAYNNERIDRFDASKIKPRIERAKGAFAKGDCDFATEILAELEAEGNLDAEITLLRAQIEESAKQKRIRQLFEGAETRLEQDEIPLALEKLSDILKLDPENAEALAMGKRIEKQRSEQQISGWMRLARQHLERHDFQEARQALKEVLNLSYDEAEAIQLKSDVDAREREAIKARGEKEQLYSSALKAHQNGEISSALSKLEKILDLSRGFPGATVPEREKVFQAFYNNVRSERDNIDDEYAEACRHLNEKNFEKALRVCDKVLSKYIRNTQFQALRLKVEQAQRQELSAYIVQVGKSVDSEPNLDRRVGILEEACQRYPDEEQFRRLLGIAREHRELISSILAKAKSYEEQLQFGEAIGQWKILATIHPQYPGMDFEINQLERRREQQGAEEKKARFVERIDHAIEQSAFAEAARLAEDALLEFPKNAELTALERIARQGLERTQEAKRLLEEARQVQGVGQWEQATELLRRALDLDGRNFGIKSALINLLVERAHASLNENWQTSETLAEAARQLDPEHPLVKRIWTLIAETKRKDYVATSLSKAREMQRVSVGGAIAILEQGLAVCPNEARLIQTRNNLKNLLPDSPKQFPGGEEKAKKAAAGATVPYLPAGDRTKVFEASDPEGFSFSFPKTGFYSNPELDRTIGGLGAKGNVPEQRIAVDRPVTSKTRKGPGLTWITALLRHSRRLQLQVRTELYNISSVLWERGRTLKAAGYRGKYLAGLALGLAMLIAGLSLFLFHHDAIAPAAALMPSYTDLVIEVNPGDAEVHINGNVQVERRLRLRSDQTYDVRVSRLGYVAAHFESKKPTPQGWSFFLAPERLHVSVSAPEVSGNIALDGRKVGNLTQSDLTTFELASDGADHKLTASNKSGELFSVKFRSSPGLRPTIEPFDTKDLVVTSSLGSRATVLSGTLPKAVAVAGKPPLQIERDGVDVNLEGVTDGLTITDSKRSRTLAVSQGNAPCLSVSLETNPNLSSVTITTAAPSAVLFADGRKIIPRRAGGWYFKTRPGLHTLKLVAQGMQDSQLSVQVGKGANVTEHIEMKPVAVRAELLIEGATPGAQVVVDGKEMGTVDETGGLHSLEVTPGLHQIELRKDGYDPVTIRQPFTAGEQVKLPGMVKLTPQSGYMAITIAPRNARVRYQRVNESEWHSGAPGNSISLLPGKYEVAADAENFEPARKLVTIFADKTTPVDFALVLLKAAQPVLPLFENPGQLLRVGEWWTGSTNAFVPLRLGITRCNLVFLRPDKFAAGVHRPKRLEWSIALDPETRVSYSLNNQQLIRKVRADGKESRLAEEANASDGNVAYSLVAILDAHGLQIKRRDGALLDDFRDDRRDWSRARIAIKGDAYFVVREQR